MTIRTWVKWGLFISSYAPLFLILFVKHLSVSPMSWVILCIAIAGFIMPKFLIKVANQLEPSAIILDGTVDANNEGGMAYMVGYIIPFLSIDLNTWNDIISILILLIMLGVVYVRSNLLYINPVFQLYGYNIVKVEYEGAFRFLAYKGKSLERQMRADVYKITDEFYIVRREIRFDK